ncbi:SulP family inorganic anion transporter [Brevifollis gellanilyticus]|uniref:Sulfate permease n=1 Tax=Brevifollis gellanilyticus TaxID=748831 RepID=A0A512M8C9_9BACT|nr:SulP family inorganic anion transporter [Brevifollis gellanilyticus]GEP42998.1 sulfate permease [Brevifollis gellanilyticus]
MLASNTLDPLPFRRWLKGYGPRRLKADARAAASVTLLDLPQGMAYAAIAGLPLQFGTMCSAIAAITGSLFSSSRYTVLGPTNSTAFMIFSYFAANPDMDRIAMMPLLVFMVGTLLLFGAFLRVAELVQYISRTVVVAYVTGASLLIITNQLANLLGIVMTTTLEDGSTLHRRTLPGILIHLTTHLREAHWQSLAIAAGTALIYVIVRRLRPAWPALALSLILASAIAAGLSGFGIAIDTYANARFGILDLLPPFPDFVSPRFFSDFSHMFGLAIAVAFLATLESSSMAKTLASVSGQRVDGNQDMFSLGMANLSCAYLSGMPCSGSLTRSALNFQSGARTPVAAMLNGIFCLIGALTLGHLVGYIPRASLAVLIICVAISLINQRNIRICLSATGSDALVFLVTLAATLLVPLHVAIFTGVGVSVMLYLRKASQPVLVEYEFNQEGNLAEAAQHGKRQNPAVSIIHAEGELFFGSADLFRTQIQRTCADPNLRIIILRLKNARHLDATCVIAIEELVRLLRKDGRELLISGVMKDVYRVLRDSGLIDTIGKDNIFPASPSNPNLATRNALKRAQQILGTTEADVKIFFDPTKKPA